MERIDEKRLIVGQKHLLEDKLVTLVAHLINEDRVVIGVIIQAFILLARISVWSGNNKQKFGLFRMGDLMVSI